MEAPKLIEEIWKDVVGYEGKYQVSTLGNVRSISYRKAKAIRGLKLSSTIWGYLRVTLSVDKIKKTLPIQRLVAIAFIPNPENKRTVNHKNGIRTDNRLDNLEWMTHSENTLHGFRCNGRIPTKSALGKFGKLNPRSKPINQLTLDGIFIKRWECAQQVKRELGRSSNAISRVCNNREQKTAYGFKWEFAK